MRASVKNVKPVDQERIIGLSRKVENTFRKEIISFNSAFLVTGDMT